jgi:hypothetical protein
MLSIGHATSSFSKPPATPHDIAYGYMSPAALILNVVNPIMVQGAELADFNVISEFDVDITLAIANGAVVEIDPSGRRRSIRNLKKRLEIHWYSASVKERPSCT